MGLDFSHGSAHWSYRGFDIMRQEIAYKLYNFDLNECIGFGGKNPFPDVLLRPFLDHNDCDGYLTPKEMAQCLPELEKVMPFLENDYDRSHLVALMEGMLYAIRDGENLQFT